jgi:hypothetical protein
MKLVHEDEDGAYLGVGAEFLKEFVNKESNPNFEVYDSRDNQRRLVVVKSSRIPDDQYLNKGRYGIDFHRARPTLQEALQYGAELPQALESRQWLADIAFAANTREEYDRKSSAWENFYSYIWGSTPQTVWVVPHSGSVNRAPDDILPYPKLWIDAFTAGVAASCAFNDRNKTSKRIMIAIHGTGHLGAVLNLGDFGVVDKEKLDIVAKKMEMKYHERAQFLADEYKQDFNLKTTKILEYIQNIRGTLNPEELSHISRDDSFTVGLYVKGLGLYGQEIKEFTFAEFKRAIKSLGKIEVPIISNNYFYTARNIGKLLKLTEKIGQGLLYSALNIECSKLYLAREPELITNIILDIKKLVFDK